MIDSTGREIKIGDKVTHTLGSIPWSAGKDEDPKVWKARYDAHSKMSDGFDGFRTVDGFASSTCIRIGGGARPQPLHRLPRRVSQG